MLCVIANKKIWSLQKYTKAWKYTRICWWNPILKLHFFLNIQMSIHNGTIQMNKILIMECINFLRNRLFFIVFESHWPFLAPNIMQAFFLFLTDSVFSTKLCRLYCVDWNVSMKLSNKLPPLFYSTFISKETVFKWRSISGGGGIYTVVWDIGK